MRIFNKMDLLICIKFIGSDGDKKEKKKEDLENFRSRKSFGNFATNYNKFVNKIDLDLLRMRMRE